jgi:integrase
MCSRGRTPMTLSVFHDEFIAYATANYSVGTAKLFSHSLKAFMCVVGDKPIKFVTAKDVDRFKTERSRAVSPVSTNIEFRTLKSIFNVAVRWKMLVQNVFTQCRPLRVPFADPAYLTKSDFSALLQAVKEIALRDLFMFAVGTMMRRGEILNLEWTDVDFKRGMIRVRSKVGFTVKGLRPRSIPMSQAVRGLLLARKRESGYVFPSPKGEKLKGAYISHRFKDYVRKASLPDAIHFHSLRHTGATWLVQQGVPLYSVQQILGHTSPNTTQIYSHLSDSSLQGAIERMEFPHFGLALN